MRVALSVLLLSFSALVLARADAGPDVKRREDEMARMLAQRVPSGEELFCAKQRVAVEAAKWDIDNHIERRPVYLEPGFIREPLKERELLQQRHALMVDELRVRCGLR